MAVPVNRNLNPNQLSMLMTGGQLKSFLNESADRERASHDYTQREPMESMWARKEDEAKAAPYVPAWYGHGAGLYDSIASNGWQGTKPLKVRHSDDTKFVTDAHHRIAALAALDKQRGTQTFVPVEHDDWGPAEFSPPSSTSPQFTSSELNYRSYPGADDR